MANTLDIPCYSKSIETEAYTESNSVSIQMAARTLRYDWFYELASEFGFDFVLTAHHADDNLETFLINISRGTGLEGVLGIPERNNIFVRPLLPFTKKQILAFAKQNSWKWREDISNQQTKYVRNKLRHEVIPSLKDSSEGFLQNFQRTLHFLSQSHEFIEGQVQLLKASILEIITPDHFKISINKLSAINAEDIFLFYILKPYGFTAWDDIKILPFAQPGKQIFSKTHRIIKDREYLIVTKILEDEPETSYVLNESTKQLEIPIGLITLQKIMKINEYESSSIYVTSEMLKFPLTVRKWKEGDYFYPFGMKGKKKLSKYFKDKKLSLIEKEAIWVLCSDDKIIWIINYRADDRFKITSKTKDILKISLT